MKDYLFLVNPVSGKGKGRIAIPLIEDICNKSSVKYSVVETKYREHAAEIVENNQGSFKNIIAVGGDGTLNEVVNGLTDDPSVNIGVLPVGSGNDFVKNLNYPKNIKDIISFLIDPDKHKTGKVDMGFVKYYVEGSSSAKTRKFLNNMGIGFDAQVGYLNQENKIIGSVLSYIYSVIKALFNYEMIELSSLNGVKGNTGERLMISIGNGICSGGGFYLNPGAKIDDGLLNVSIFDKITRRRLLNALPLALMNKLNKVPEAKMDTTEYLEIELKNPYYAHCDGEIISHRLKRAEIKIIKNRINIITGMG